MKCFGGFGVNLLLGLSILLVAGCSSIPKRPEANDPDLSFKRLTRVGSAAQLEKYLEHNRQWFAAADAYRMGRFCAEPANAGRWECRVHLNNDSENPGLDRIEVTGSRISASDVITNNQELGVDEGDIVKKLGDRLFVLRQGKLHVIDIVAAGQPVLALRDTLVVATDVDDDSSTWYDEILTAGDQLYLLGYNWGAEAAELSLFDVQADGQLLHRMRYWISVDDYFSGSNYGGRIERDNLLVQVSLGLGGKSSRWPQWRRRDLDGSEWKPLLEPDDVHLPLSLPRDPVVHAVLRCPLQALSEGTMDCTATGVIGSGSSEFYASANAAYLAIADWEESVHLDPRIDYRRVKWGYHLGPLAARQHTLVYRMPFKEGGELGVARVDGVTGNQFSFSELDGRLFVTTELVSAEEERQMTLWRIDDHLFDDSSETRADIVATLPVDDTHRTVRFTPKALWIGAWHWSDGERESSAPLPLLRQPLDGAALQHIDIAHSVDLIEPLGQSVLISGQQDEGSGWQLSLVDDSSSATSARDRLAVPGYLPSEARSHAFNAGQVHGRQLFGMPVVAADVESPWDKVSDLTLFKVDPAGLQQLVHVDMQQPVDCDDHCYNWYGNARVFFIGNRVFAMSGGLLRELVAPASGRARVVRSVSLE